MKYLFSLVIFISLNSNSQDQDKDLLEKIRWEIKSDSFNVKTKKCSIPRFVYKHFKKVDRDRFRIVNPTKRYNVGDALINSSRPNKRLIYVAKGKQYIIVVYEQGGFGKKIVSRLLKYRNKSVECSVTFYPSRPYAPDQLIKSMDNIDTSIKEILCEK